MEPNQIIHGDAYEILPTLPDKSVDMILTDPPYGQLDCEWDCKIDLQALWHEFNRVIKDDGAMVICSRQPFATDVIVSNRKWFRYEIVWEKTMPVGFFDANRMPLRSHENMLVFYHKLPVYNPQKTPGKPYTRKHHGGYVGYTTKKRVPTENPTGERYPKTVLKISNQNGGGSSKATKHPTQKPIDLFSWFIKTYTNEGDIVLDPFSGSGTTAITCSRLNRQFICIEKEQEFYEYSLERLNGDVWQPELDMDMN